LILYEFILWWNFEVMVTVTEIARLIEI